jgi:hypothetical protein
MHASRFTEEQSIFVLNQAELGISVPDVCRRLVSPTPRFWCGGKSTAEFPSPN